MFPRTNFGSLEHIRGSDCLRDVVAEIPLKQRDLIRSTTLRKHIATMTQLHNMKDNELDVLAQYMDRVHYQLPSARVQVAKVAKFLITMESGRVLTDEETNDDTIYEDTTSPNDVNPMDGSEDDDECSPSQIESVEPQSVTIGDTSCPVRIGSHRAKENPQRNMNGRTPWSDREQAAVMKHLGNFVYLGTIPGKAAIEAARQKDALLTGRSWLQIKNFVRNKIISKQRQ